MLDRAQSGRRQRGPVAQAQYFRGEQERYARLAKKADVKLE